MSTPPHSTNGTAAGEGPGAFGETNGHTPTKATNGARGGTADANGSSSSSSMRAATTSMPEVADYVGFRPIYEGSKIDRQELVRLTMQTLKELGYESSAKTLEAEAGITLEHPSISAFRMAVLGGDWRNAERLLVDGLTYAASRRNAASRGISNGSTSSPDLSVVLRDPVDRPLDSVKFLLQQQRYLELLESGQTKKALSVLRDRLTPLNHGSERLHQLSSLVMCNSAEELRLRANWQGSGVESRRRLLQEIELSVSPSVMLPSRRLPQLLEQAQTLQKQLDPFFNLPLESHVSLYTDHRSDRSIFPTQTTHILRGHDDEVWVMAFSNDGRYLATGGKDKMVIIWSVSPEHCEKVKQLGPHSAAISCVSWSPDNKTLLAGSDTDIYQWEWESEESEIHREHKYQIFAVAWLHGGQGFVSGGMDGKVIFWDRHGRVVNTWPTSPYRVIGLAVTPDGKYIVAISWRPAEAGPQQSSSGSGATSSSSRNSSQSYGSESASPSPGGAASTSRSIGLERSKIHFWDVQQKREVGSINMIEEMVSVTVSDDSRYVLINQRPNEAHVWDIATRTHVFTYKGHRLNNNMARCCFGGSEQSFIVSGSEDSSIYIYHRTTGQQLERLTGHGPGAVNTVAWHPTLPSLFASCSDDGTVRIWQPGSGSAGAGPERSRSQPSHLPRDSAGTAVSSPVDGGDGPVPFPWSMSPLRPSSPETEVRNGGAAELGGIHTQLAMDVESEGESEDEEDEEGEDAEGDGEGDGDEYAEPGAALRDSGGTTRYYM